ncbi:MAG: ribonucleoside-diphosphate reductase subunit alpha [Acidimicrobiales bacterium]|nr:MAG: ribonucleoside-diphosphate reductase subunit alpha [Acidimicrobiales bacterium]
MTTSLATSSTVPSVSAAPRADGPSLGTTTHVIRRDGTVSPYDASKISTAMTKAFLAVEGEAAGGSARVREIVAELTEHTTAALFRHLGTEQAVHIEQIQDQVELVLMRGGHHKVARAYVLYREERAKARDRKLSQDPTVAQVATIHVRGVDEQLRPLDRQRVALVINEACEGLENVSEAAVLAETLRNLYDGISTGELELALIMAARTLVESEPNYTYVSARLLMDKLRREVLSAVSASIGRAGGSSAKAAGAAAYEGRQGDENAGRDVPAGLGGQASQAEMTDLYGEYFHGFISRGIEAELLDPALASFDLARLGQAILPERDLDFQFLGLQTLYDRYLLHVQGARIELPQAFFMRVAMGLALREDDREARAIQFYQLLSSFDFMSSTPTLFNSGTTRAQLSSCFLTTTPDDLDGIFQGIKNNALLAKYSGGLGNDWTSVRGMGAHIKGTNGQSQGVVPFLKIANDTAVAVNQGGKRKGAVCAYLETWHIDIEEFLDLRKNTGDDRRRTHDMNTANWVPDLFLERVEQDANWTLFSPNEVPDLHDLYGSAFAQRYAEHEAAAARGEIKVYRTVRAVDLWRRMLTMLFETGHPWITFKDSCNIRSPQRHIGVVHSSNLCTEITLNTSAEEVAVCNLGSVNLANHITAGRLDTARLEYTVTTAVRMLDNVIDINYYTIPEARTSNLRHRPVGLGLMGFQDALFELRVPMSSQQAVEFADSSMEQLSYFAITASCALAAERGRYPSFDGSLWSQGILPIDSLELLAKERNAAIDVDTTTRLDWGALREKVRTVGMRNSNVMAIAPTATISNICGVAQSIEPLYRNLYVKSNMSGDFTVSNPYLVRDLKTRGLWDEVMISDLKYFDGSLGPIDRIPADLKALYATAFEVNSSWLIDAASRRQKWIDQAQSLNLYMDAPSGRKLDELYRHAWRKGLKTCYYLRSQSATHVEKSTLTGTDGKLNAVAATASTASVAEVPLRPEAATTEAASCSIDNPECEACQ